MPRKLTPTERVGRQIAREQRAAIDAYIHREHPVFTPEEQVAATAIYTSDKERPIVRQIEAAASSGGKWGKRVYFELYDCSTDRWSQAYANPRPGGENGITSKFFLDGDPQTNTPGWRQSGLSLAAYLLNATGDYSGASPLKNACIIRLYVVGGMTRTEVERQYLASTAATGLWKPGKPIGEMKAAEVHRKAGGLQKLESQGILGQFSPTEINRFLRGHGVTPEHPNRAPRPAVRFPK